MTACKICEAPTDPSQLFLCDKCSAHPVLVAAFAEGLVRITGCEVVLEPRVPVTPLGTQ